MFKNKYNEDLTGKILFLFSIVILAVMNAIIFIKPFMEIDEWFTKGIVQHSASQVVAITGIDVHPPLYYLLLKVPMKILSMLNMNYDLVFLIKFMSLVPLIILILVCITKIRKDYGWLTCGFFSLSLVVMSSFFTDFLTARMYSWAIMFLVLAFICVGDILKNSSYKSWVLLAIFSTLGAYTHYFAAISAVVMYVLLLLNIIVNRKSGFDKSDVKKWIVSTIIGIVLYIPWVFTLMGQLTKVHKKYWIHPLDFNDLITSLSITFTSNLTFVLDVFLAAVVLAIFAIVLARYLKNRTKENSYILMGVSVYIVTLAAAIIISFTFKPILLERYLLPSVAVFWLAVSILMSEYDFKKYVMPILIIFLLFAAFNVVDQINGVEKMYDKTLEVENVLDELNNNDTIVFYKGVQKYVRYDKELTNATRHNVFVFGNTTYKEPYIKLLKLDTANFTVPDDVYNNTDKQIIFISDSSNQWNSSDVNIDRFFNFKGSVFYNVTAKNQ